MEIKDALRLGTGWRGPGKQSDDEEEHTAIQQVAHGEVLHFSLAVTERAYTESR
jgi:hypothetical protein